MAGTKIGGLKAAAKNKELYGSDFYANIGAIGGRKGKTGGFAARNVCSGKCNLTHIVGLNHRVAQCAGYKGGVKSRRTYGN